ncbi:hypothetical protein JDS99_28580 [Bacillus cereus group sp. N6]|uniref:hypothetical protein n=1 Tax=Bacillus cereus group sp. N6 TaxID=2794583 RepID=UPI0018F36E71|nr:hypothetical protein [Bacillus cereus group sp. N6]MBJ8113509.1 hypothetical protein [Bacillus cereus group sp. N6]
MNFSSTLQAEIQILKNLISYYEQSEDEHASSLVITYKHGLQALLHVYEASQQTEHIPF